MRITVVGLGKIGLPLAVQYARKGYFVVGSDITQGTVDAVNRGVAPFPGEAHLAEYLAEVVADGRLRATSDTTGAVASSSVVVVAVPLFVDAEARPDFAAMDAATTAIGKGLTPGALVCFETTLPVGTTRSRLTPILEAASGLAAGAGFNVAFSPERVFTGRVFSDLARYPKLVGGLTRACEDAGVRFYEAVLDFDERPDLPRPNGVWRMGSAEAAEMAKLAETTYRDVNIGLANQFSVYALKAGIDIHAVIEACNSQPFSHIHQPGISVGGHCIPVYPRLYLWNDPDATIVRAAREVNASMPERAVERLEAELGSLEGLTVMILGAAYRPGVKETAFSGVFALVDSLERRGAKPIIHDPLFTDDELSNLGLTAGRKGDPATAVILHTDHPQYVEWCSNDVPGVRFVVDGRKFLNEASWQFGG